MVGFDLETAYDLTDRGIERLKLTAAEIAKKYEISTVLSSPTARTLHTARIIMHAFNEHEHDIQFKIENGLREIENYNRSVFERAVIEAFGYDKNREEYRLSEIFFNDIMYDEDVQEKLSVESRRALDKFERSREASERIFALLSRLQGSELLVTHDAVAAQLVERFSSNSRMSMKRGKFVALQNIDGVWKMIDSNDPDIKFERRVE